MAGRLSGSAASGDIGLDVDDDASHRERARYLRQMVEKTPGRPDRERLLELADQYDRLADRPDLRTR